MSIFQKTLEKVETTDTSILSFKDCPNRCIDGFYVDPYKHKKIQCDFCKDKREKMVKQGLDDESSHKTIKALLKLPSTFSGVNFSIDNMLIKEDIPNLDPIGLDIVKVNLEQCVNDIAVGSLPTYSILFELGNCFHISQFICAYLLRSYLAGLKTCPLISGYDLVKLRQFSNEYIEDKEMTLTYADVLDADTVLVFLDKGSGYAETTATSGLVELRGMKDKATIVVTSKMRGETKYLYTKTSESFDSLKSYGITYSNKKRDILELQEDSVKVN